MRFLIGLIFFALVNVAQAEAPGADIIGGPNFPGGKVQVLKFFPGVFIRQYVIFINKQPCTLVVSTSYSDTPAGQSSNTSTQVICPK